MSDNETNVWSSISSKILGWIAPVLIGALLTLMLTIAGEKRQVEINTAKVAQLEAQVRDLQQNYASNKRVDDLTAEVRSNYKDLKGGTDEILRLLIQFQRGR